MQIPLRNIRFIGFVLMFLTTYGDGSSTNTSISTEQYTYFLAALIPEQKCGMNSFSLTTHICEMLFFLELKSRPDALCLEVYKKLSECIQKKLGECNYRLPAYRSDQDTSKFRYLLKNQYCNDGSLSLKKSGPINYCDTVNYNNNVETCYEEYHRAFRRNASDESLCVKYMEAKACANDAEQLYCQYGNEVLGKIPQYSNIDRCWNPFCGPIIPEFQSKILDRGFTFSYLSKEIQSHLRKLARKYRAEGFDRELLCKGVSKKSCSFNQAVVISNAIIHFLNYSSPDGADKYMQTESNSIRDNTENNVNPSKKTKRTPARNIGSHNRATHLILIVAILILLSRVC